jgi:integrase
LSQVDFENGLIVWIPRKLRTERAAKSPFLKAIWEIFFLKPRRRDGGGPDSEWVFDCQGTQVRDIRGSWRIACIAADVPELNFHDLRRTAVRNMGRAGVPQVIRMKTSGHKTNSMERRYNIVDADDINIAKEFMERRRKSAKRL